MNLTIGAIENNVERLTYLSPSYSYYQSSIIFVVPRGVPYLPFENLIRPLKIYIWICVFSTFGLGLLVILALRLDNPRRREFVVGAHNRTPYMNMFSVMLGNSMTMMPRRNFARYLLTVWMLACIVLRNTYQGSLFQFLKSPNTKPPIELLDDLIRENYTLYMPSLAFYLFRSITSAHPLYNQTIPCTIPRLSLKDVLKLQHTRVDLRFE